MEGSERLNNIFRGKGVEDMSDLEKLGLLKMTEAVMENEELNITAIGFKISLCPFGVTGSMQGSKGLLKKLGLEGMFEEFQKEISPIAEKYAQIISSRV